MASIRVWVVTAIVLVCLLAGPTDGWGRRRRRRRCPAHTSALPGAINSWDQAFRAQCPRGHVISRVQSVHCNTAEDRVWRFECRRVPGLSYFHIHVWSNWINSFDGHMSTVCGHRFVVTGFQSEHSNNHEDRRWRLRCSYRIGMTTYNHRISHYANSWDGAMNYYVPYGYYIWGMNSYQSNRYGDRRYRFHLIKIRL